MIEMLSIRPPRWLPRLTSQKDTEDAHELLAQHEPSDQPIARWAQTRSYGAFNIPLCSSRIKALFTVLFVLLIVALVTFRRSEIPTPQPTEEEEPRWPWQDFRRLDGYYQGISKLVKAEHLILQNWGTLRAGLESDTHTHTHTRAPASTTKDVSPAFKLVPYTPRFEDLPVTVPDQLPPRQQCFLDVHNTVPAPSIYAFEGVPQGSIEPTFGSYDVLTLRKDICFDRYGRYGPYGLGYSPAKGGNGMGLHGDQSLTTPIWSKSGYNNWSAIDLGDAQKRCRERNQGRYPSVKEEQHNHVRSTTELAGPDGQHYRVRRGNSNKISRTAIVLRSWIGLEYLAGTKMYIQSLVNELSLQSGGEYDVHLLVEVKNESLPFSTSKTVYDEILAESIPPELQSMTTLWSQDLMKQLYPGPFEPQFHDHGSMYPAMRSMHFALQWFMLQHPEYEYIWNWEMDIRYIGHWYELLDGVSKWAKKQPRNHIWARNARYYIPSLYDNNSDNWEAFAHDTAQQSPSDITDKPPFKPNPPPSHEDNNGQEEEEEADFITFNPIFNPDQTNWNRREDVTGYPTTLPIPERRASIIAASRFSRRLLQTMHHENSVNRHSMASEMFPPSMSLHHGFKAVFAPHPVYLEREWNATYASAIFNGGPNGGTDGYEDSVFGVGPKGTYTALKQSTYYYEAEFAEFLWWRWLGYRDFRYGDEGGAEDELKKSGSWWRGDRRRKGRMCLRSMLFHPVKWDEGRSI